MARTYNTMPGVTSFSERHHRLGTFSLCRWESPGQGKWWKRQYHKAVRRWQKGHGGRERSALNYGSECNWKTW